MAGFVALLTIVVPVDKAELLLVLLIVRIVSLSTARSASFLPLVAADLPPAAFGRPGFAFSAAMCAKLAVAAAVLIIFGGGAKGFNGEAVRT